MKRATVRALRLEVLHPRAVLAMAAGRWRSELYHGGAGSPLRLVEVPAPNRPRGWVRIRPSLSGICGSDLKTLRLVGGLSPTLTALTGLPRRTIPGHEIVGHVLESPDGAGPDEGDLVVVDPSLSCADKGRTPCPSCEGGRPQLCHDVGGGGELTPGHGAGYHADYGGGWAEEVVAPAGRVFPVPDGLDERFAVLAEPMGVAVQAVAQGPPSSDDHVLVIAPGTIGLCVVHALRALVPDATITVAGVSPDRDALSRAAGADGYVQGTHGRLVEAAATRLDRGVDWTLVWVRDLVVRGTYAYGVTDIPDGAMIDPGRRHAMEAGLDVLEACRPELVTHVFELEQRVTALETAAAGPDADAVKVAFAP